MSLFGLFVLGVIGYACFSDKKTPDNKRNNDVSEDKIVRNDFNSKMEASQINTKIKPVAMNNSLGKSGGMITNAKVRNTMGASQMREIINSIDVSFPLYTKVSGVSFENRQQYVKNCNSNQRLILVREKDNSYDRNAIAVHTTCNQVGYIKKELASKLAPLMDCGVLLEGYVEQVTGGNGNLYGLNIRVIRKNNQEMLTSIMLCMDEPTQHMVLGKPFMYSKIGIRGNMAYIFEYYSGKCYRVDTLCGKVAECPDTFEQGWDEITTINKGSVLWCVANTIGICAMMWSGSSPFHIDDVFSSITAQLNYDLAQCNYKVCLTRHDWTTTYGNKRVDLCNLVQSIPKYIKIKSDQIVKQPEVLQDKWTMKKGIMKQSNDYSMMRSIIPDNTMHFESSSYICPFCSEHLNKILLHKMYIQVNDTEYEIDKSFSCKHCGSFFAPVLGHYLNEGYYYLLRNPSRYNEIAKEMDKHGRYRH